MKRILLIVVGVLALAGLCSAPTSDSDDPRPTEPAPIMTSVAPTDEQPETTAPAPASPTPTNAEPTQESTDPAFDTCGDANNAGYGDYQQGRDPEYDWYDDRDGDGWVCETS